MSLTINSACCLALFILGLWVAPASADDGDSAICVDPVCLLEDALAHLPRGAFADLSRPGSVLLLSEFERGLANLEVCEQSNVPASGLCQPRTEIEIGAVCPTLFTFDTQPASPCPEHEPVRVRFLWVCPPDDRDLQHKFVCKTSGFDVNLTVNGKVVFTADGSRLPDANQVPVPAAPCKKGYLIGWVVDNLGRPIKYDGLIGKAVIRTSTTAAVVYRAVPIQAEASMTTRSLIELVSDPLHPERSGLPFDGQPGHYRLVTGQVTGDVTFDRRGRGRPEGFGSGAGSGLEVRTSLILLTLDIRSNGQNFPTRVPLDFWNGFEKKLSSSVAFICWGEFRLSTDIDPKLTEALMKTGIGIVQSGDATKEMISGISDVITDIRGLTTLLGLVRTDEGLISASPMRSYAIEFFDNGIAVHYAPSMLYP
jgi:hypothetical protein